MSGKKSPARSFLLRLDASAMEAVEKWAADEFRSVNGQLQWIVAEALKKHRRFPKNQPDQSNDPDSNEYM